MTDLIAAELIYDYQEDLSPALPAQLWPQDCKDIYAVDEALRVKQQYRGTHAELLTEIAGRVCYDSFGRGRDSVAYHEHILEVGHLSVAEHFNFTVAIPVEEESLAVFYAALANRPGLYVNHSISDDGEHYMRLTLNLRTAVEWHDWSPDLGHDVDFFKSVITCARQVGGAVRQVANQLAPQIVILEDRDRTGYYEATKTTPVHDEERWITMLLTGGRGMSHELVRHGDRTAISQRSTRYVDESESPWITHPLLRDFLDQTDDFEVEEATDRTMAEAQDCYREIVAHLQPWLVSQGLDKLTARKQARGAARGYLGNALYTEVVFSASVAQWKRILHQRAHPAADAEIRELFAQGVFPQLRESQYSDSFDEEVS